MSPMQSGGGFGWKVGWVEEKCEVRFGQTSGIEFGSLISIQ